MPTTFPPFPPGVSQVEIEQELEQLRASDSDVRATFGDRWLNDRGLLLDDGALQVAKKACDTFFTKSNSSSVVMPLEGELVAWVLGLFHGGPDAAGVLTGGGSESLFLATAAAFAKFRGTNVAGTSCEVVIPETGYPTFEKYRRYLGYSVRRVPVDGAFRADPDVIDAAITDKTFMILGSMSSWAHGACDPIPALAKVAQARNVWLHVDACVGGMLAPFGKDLGREIPEFDFAVPGVSSISVDFHKYGYCAKGVSGLFFRDRKLAEHQTFTFDDWAAGYYRSPVLTGTRSGGAIASAWAVAKFLGREGYRRRAAQVFKARDRIVAAIEAIPDLVLLGGGDLGTVAIGSNTLDILAVSSGLGGAGWNINNLTAPDGIQLVLGPVNDQYIDAFVEDLAKAVDKVKGEAGRRPSRRVVYSDEIAGGPGALC
jgi:glutamate/tyrosine decarboxylase-like PLP-dependent enzyme